MRLIEAQIIDSEELTMDLNKVDLNLFIVLDAIYTESSLSGAARRLYVTQPAVSAALGRLRELFGDPLFVRNGRQMVPTPATENIIRQVREALALMRSSIDKTYQFMPSTEERTFRFGMSDLAESIVLPRLYKVLEQEAPKMRLQVMQLNRREAMRSLSAGQLDFVIDAPVLASEQLCHCQLFSGEYVAIVREGHPVLKDELTFERYLQLSHLHVSSRTTGLGYVDYALERLNAKRRIVLRTQHYLMAGKLVAETDLCATVLSYFADFPGTRMLKLPFELEPQGHHLYWHINRDSDPAIRWIKDTVLQIAQEPFR